MLDDWPPPVKRGAFNDLFEIPPPGWETAADAASSQMGRWELVCTDVDRRSGLPRHAHPE